MDDKENKNWSEITDDLKNVRKKIVKKVDDENLVNDIKQSFSETLENTSDILDKLITKIENTINDEEIKSEASELINNLKSQLSNSFSGSDETFLSLNEEE
tara:strand:- start:29 stop:331 length:303 start_codon:yes stop_codon:yes gene_type:complete